MSIRRVGITIGDVRGIGVEVLLKTFASRDLFERCTPVVFGTIEAMEYWSEVLGMSIPLLPVGDLSEVSNGVLNVMTVASVKGRNPLYGADHLAIAGLNAGVRALRDCKVHTLVTAPVNKKSIQSVVSDFDGHTRYIGQFFGGNPLMIMASQKLRMALVTDHLPLSRVTSSIDRNVLYRKIALFYKILRRDFAIDEPKIAVLGINPHAGDSGGIGAEDEEITSPVVQTIKERGERIEGPFSSDGFFGSGMYKKFDGVVAMYHDQGLIPFKLMSFGSGVNYTGGLEGVRTSPDHGTAYEIAGKNIANSGSFRQAVLLSLEIYRNRLAFDQRNNIK